MTDKASDTIAARMAGAGFRLRFDRVALRVARGLESALEGEVIPGECLILTLAAPIRLPARVVPALAEVARSVAAGGRFAGVVEGNAAQALRLTDAPAGAPRVVVLVHSPSPYAQRLVEAALGAVLRGGSGCGC